MHWIRIDRYYEGSPENPTALHQPVLCMHCENAPVRARLPGRRHDAQRGRAQRDDLQPLRRHAVLLEQLSVQGPPLQLLRLQRGRSTSRSSTLRCANPDVTVRSARRHGEVHLLRPAHQPRPGSTPRSENRPIRDGEIVTACQQACPTEAHRLRRHQRPGVEGRGAEEPSTLNYALLDELNTRPRTTYLAKLSNPESGVRRERGIVPTCPPPIDRRSSRPATRRRR